MEANLDSLDTEELHFLKNLIRKSKINIELPKKFNSIKKKKPLKKISEVGLTKKSMLNQFKIKTGEILSGNTGSEIKSELKSLCRKMLDKGYITTKQCSDVVKKFC
jgi:hypothetical protein